MKAIRRVVIGGLLCFSAPLSAGVLYGVLIAGSTPARGAAIAIACPGFPAPGAPTARVNARAVTDANGSYAIRIAASGRCQMRVERDNTAGPPFDVIISDNPLRLDLTVDGALRRVR